MIYRNSIYFLAICLFLSVSSAFAVSYEEFTNNNHNAEPALTSSNSANKYKKSIGSGFLVTKEGHIVTNAHVVSECNSINVTQGNGKLFPAKVLFKSEKEDIALILSDIKNKDIASFRISPIIKLGENVYVYGFPLKGALSTSGNFTSGNITALAGFRDDTGEVQISAPVQPGNSGGPLLDSGGRVIGIVTSKLNALKLAEVTNDIAQNINFAIKGPIIINFLSGHGVDILEDNEARALSPVEIAEKSKQFTYCIECIVSPTTKYDPKKTTANQNNNKQYNQHIRLMVDNIVFTTRPEKLDTIKSYFADVVYFYGKSISREDVFNQKVKYLQRWDVLNYEIVDFAVTPMAGDTEFLVKVKIKFFGKRADKKVRGITETTWVVANRSDGLKITSETSKILERF